MRWRAATIVSLSPQGRSSDPISRPSAAIAPHAILVAGTLTDAGTASARQRLLDAGFADVTVLGGSFADNAAETAAAA